MVFSGDSPVRRGRRWRQKNLRQNIWQTKKSQYNSKFPIIVPYQQGKKSLSKIKFKMRRLSNPVPDGMASSSVRAGLIFEVSGWETGTFSSFPAWGTFFFSPLFLMRGEKKKKRNLSCTFPLSPSFFCGFGDMMPRQTRRRRQQNFCFLSFLFWRCLSTRVFPHMK